MKKSTLILITGILALVLVIALIMYMKPDTTIVEPTASQQTTDNTVVDIASTQETTTESTVETSTPTVNNESSVDDTEVDFNAEVYGNELIQDDEVVNEDGTVTSTAPILNNPASDPDIEPIAPEDDPANQIYSAPAEETTE